MVQYKVDHGTYELYLINSTELNDIDYIYITSSMNISAGFKNYRLI